MPAREPDTLVTPADRFNPLLTAADLMTDAPRTCSPFSTVLEAVMVFRDAGCGLVPVVDAGRPVGVLTDRDVTLAFAEYGDRLREMPVGEVMTPDVVTVRSEDRLDAVIKAFAGRAVRRLIVVGSDGQLQGVIAWSDLAPHVSLSGLGGVADRVLRQP